MDHINKTLTWNMEGGDGVIFLLLAGLVLRDVSVLNVIDLSVNDLCLNTVGSLDQFLALLQKA